MSVVMDSKLSKGTSEFPASSAQQRLWFLNCLNPGSTAYNMPQALRLQGQLDKAALQMSINAIIQRHESLRTTFRTNGHELTQVIHKRLELDLPLVDLSNQNIAQDNDKMQRTIDHEARKPFNLEKGPLIYAVIFKLADQDYIFLLNVHHIVFDRWSEGLLNAELRELYKSFVSGKPSSLLALPLQYSDYTKWRIDKSKDEKLQSQIAYWKRQLSAVKPLILPYDNIKCTGTIKGKRQYLDLPKELLSRFDQISGNNGATLFMGLLAAFKALLYLWSGNEDIVVGTPFADRHLRGTESLMGFFVNTLVLRTDVSGDIHFVELLQRVRKVCFNAYRYSSVSFDKLVAEVQPERQINRNPLFNVEFAFQKAHSNQLQLKDLAVTPLTISKGAAQYDMTLTVRERPNNYDVRIEYRTDLFEASTIDRLLEQYKILLGNIVSDPEQKLSDISLLSESEWHRLIRQWNDTNVEYPRKLCIHGLFEKQAGLTPTAVAVEDANTSLSYQELDRRSTQLARYLKKQGNIKANTLIGICVERSVEMVVTLLGILKAGAAYLPLDKEYPNDRLAYIIQDSGIELLISQSWLIKDLPADNVRTVLIDSEADSICLENTDVLNTHVQADHLAYIIYTSGSTGQPKGVQVEHGNVVNFLFSMKANPGICADDVLLAVTTLSFDIAVLEIYLPLVFGAKSVIASHEVAIDGAQLCDTLINSGITVMQATPITWRLLLGAAWQSSPGFKVLCGGEAMPRDLACDLLQQNCQVWNMYGPTETTVWSTCYRLFDPGAPIYIGKPINNTQVYILDKNKQPVPMGATGELYIGGEGVSRGYLNRLDLTQQRFIPDPFSDDPNARLYATGDGARFHSDGNIEYRERLDNQVKVRGNRIELGEIESVLLAIKGIEQVLVIVREDQPGDARIVAYFVTKNNRFIELGEIRKFLRKNLPGYMIPQFFIELESFPLTANGKIDRKSLPVPDNGFIQEDEYRAPRGPCEAQLAEIWKEVLGVDRVGIHDSFIDLGGHSLLALQVIHRVKQEMGMEITPAAMIMDTLEQIVSDIDGEARAEESDTRVESEQHKAQTFYFGDVDKYLFGAYHPAKSNIIRGAVLLCYPMFLEGSNAHWVFRRLAAQLAAAGYHVLRFDYYGTGDSAGDSGEGDVDQWLQDIKTASKRLIELSGVSNLSAVGLRLGASLAAISDCLPFENLVLWDPVISGKDYIKALKEGHQSKVERYNEIRDKKITTHDDEMLGYLYPPQMRKSMENINLLENFSSKFQKLFLITSKEKEEYAGLHQGLYSQSQQVVYRYIKDSGPSLEEHTGLRVFLPSNALRAIFLALTGKLE